MFRQGPIRTGDRISARYQDPATGLVNEVIGTVTCLDPLSVRAQRSGETLVLARPLAVRVLSPKTVRNSEIRRVEAQRVVEKEEKEQKQESGTWIGGWWASPHAPATPIGPSAALEALPLEALRAFYVKHGQPLVLNVPERIGKPAIKHIQAHPEQWELGPEEIVYVNGQEHHRRRTATLR